MGLFKKEVNEEDIKYVYRVLMVIGHKEILYGKPYQNRKLAEEQVEYIKSIMCSRTNFINFKNGMARVKDISAVYIEDWPLLCGE